MVDGRWRATTVERQDLEKRMGCGGVETEIGYFL
jgi:hypothetical protein